MRDISDLIDGYTGMPIILDAPGDYISKSPITKPGVRIIAPCGPDYTNLELPTPAFQFSDPNTILPNIRIEGVTMRSPLWLDRLHRAFIDVQIVDVNFNGPVFKLTTSAPASARNIDLYSCYVKVLIQGVDDPGGIFSDNGLDVDGGEHNNCCWNVLDIEMWAVKKPFSIVSADNNVFVRMLACVPVQMAVNRAYSNHFLHFASSGGAGGSLVFTGANVPLVGQQFKNTAHIDHANDLTPPSTDGTHRAEEYLAWTNSLGELHGYGANEKVPSIGYVDPRYIDNMQTFLLSKGLSGAPGKAKNYSYARFFGGLLQDNTNQ